MPTNFHSGPHGPIDANPEMDFLDAFDNFFNEEVQAMTMNESNCRALIELERLQHAKLLDGWVDIDAPCLQQ